MDKTWWRKLADLDEDQKNVINIPVEKNVLLVGPPGSGKTNLLMLRAGFLDKAHEKNFAVLTFTRVLKEFIVAGTTTYEVPAQNVHTYVQWGLQLLAENGIKVDGNLEFDDLRSAILVGLKKIASKKPKDKLDYILLDEVQDYSEEEVRTIRALTGLIYAVGDSHQRIYGEYDLIDALKGTVDKFVELTYHYRNGLKICRLADGILNQLDDPDGLEANAHYDEDEMASTVRRIGGKSLEEQVAIAAKEIEDQLLAYPNEKIGIFAPRNADVKEIWTHLQKAPFKDQCVLQNMKEGYSSLTDEHRVVLSTIHGAKGLEFRACHLLATEEISKSGPNQKRVAYTACTRAKTSLRIYHSRPLPTYLEHALANIEPKPSKPKPEDLFPKED